MSFSLSLCVSAYVVDDERAKTDGALHDSLNVEDRISVTDARSEMPSAAAIRAAGAKEHDRGVTGRGPKGSSVSGLGSTPDCLDSSGNAPSGLWQHYVVMQGWNGIDSWAGSGEKSDKCKYQCFSVRRYNGQKDRESSPMQMLQVR